jgi:hypothetical protein
VNTYKVLDWGEAFGEQFIAITEDFLPECASPYVSHILPLLSNASTELAL